MSDLPIVYTRREGVVGIIVVDHPPANVLSRNARLALLREVHALDADAAIRVIVIAGANGQFIIHEDIGEIDTADDDAALSAVTAAIERSDKPVIAAVTGPALDAGLEVALACDLRLAGPNASAGLPRTRLGLIPEGGATQRLPRRAGVVAAIDLIGATRDLGATDAVRVGIFDRIVDGDVVAAAAVAAAGAEARKRRAADQPVQAADSASVTEAEAAALKRGRGVPSFAEAVALIRAAATTPFADGMRRERESFVRLRNTSEAKALRHLSEAERLAARVPGVDDVAPRVIGRVAVIGAGTMGSGVAVCLADAGLSVDLLEQNADAAAAGAERVRSLYQSRVKSGRLSEAAVAERLAGVHASDDWSVVGTVDLVIEAAFEDMAVKNTIFSRLDQLARPGVILATNTSYLDVNAIANITKRPAEVLGLHFFSPAHVMRLLEVVQADRTAPDVLATGLALGRRIGKLPIVARVCDGFIGNRIFAVYRRHAEYLLEDGASPEEIDEAVRAYGFAMGPFEVSDMSGLDIAWAMRKRRAPTRDPGERYVSIPDRLCEAGRLGRKAGRGWYDYDRGKGRPSSEVDAIIAQERERQSARPTHYTPEQIQNRILAVMANEGARVLAEGISLRPSDIDLVFVNGYGFPRLKGGPMFAADQRGLGNVLADVDEAAGAGGAGSEPAPLLMQLAQERRSFAAWQAAELSKQNGRAA